MNPVEKIIGEYDDEVGAQVDKARNSDKGIPKRDGSGRGVRANLGRGGCIPPKRRGRRNNLTEDVVENII